MNATMFRFAAFALTMFHLGCNALTSSQEESFAHQVEGSFSMGQESLSLTARMVQFKLKWNEKNDFIKGVYQDNYLSTSPTIISGKIQEGGAKKVQLDLNHPKYSTLVMELNASSDDDDESSGLISSINVYGKAGQGSVVAEDIKVSSQEAGETGSSTAGGNWQEFFSTNAGTYTYYAKNTNSKDDKVTWTHGKTYELDITSGGKITISSDAKPVEMQFGDSDEDKFESHDHEAYAVFQLKSGAKAILQRQYDNDELFLTHQIEDGAFWLFQEEDPGELPNHFEARHQMGYVVATYAHKITHTNGTGTEFKVTDDVSVTVNFDGSVSGSFGDFSYVEGETSVLNATINGKETQTVTWYSPDETTFPRRQCKLRFIEKKLADLQLIVEEDNSNNTRTTYSVIIK